MPPEQQFALGKQPAQSSRQISVLGLRRRRTATEDTVAVRPRERVHRLGDARQRPLRRLRLGRRGTRAHAPEQGRAQARRAVHRRLRARRLLRRDWLRPRTTRAPTRAPTSTRRSPTGGRPGSQTRTGRAIRSAPTSHSIRRTGSISSRPPTSSARSGSASSSPTRRWSSSTPASRGTPVAGLEDRGRSLRPGGRLAPRRRTEASAITWGKRQFFTVAFYEQYNDEAWVYITPDELRSDGTGLHGFDMEKLNAYLSALKN